MTRQIPSDSARLGNDPARPSWGVVATALESPELMLVFAAYHLALGAAEVHVMLDDPDDPAFEMLQALPGCHPVRCTSARWARMKPGYRPKSHEGRQKRNANDAYRRAGVDWLFHLDVDEFLHPVGDLRAELAAMPPGRDIFTVPVVERALRAADPRTSVFEGVFRAPAVLQPSPSPLLPRIVVPGGAPPGDEAGGPEADARLQRKLFGDDAVLLTQGLTGHMTGKSATRTGRDHFIALHSARTVERGRRLKGLTARSTLLLHFEGMTALHWAFKRVCKQVPSGTRGGYVYTGHRGAQIDSISGAHDAPGAALALFERLSVLDAGREAALRAAGMVLDLGVRLDAALALIARAGLPQPDLSPARFDAWMWSRHAQALEAFGFARPRAAPPS